MAFSRINLNNLSNTKTENNNFRSSQASLKQVSAVTNKLKLLNFKKIRFLIYIFI